MNKVLGCSACVVGDVDEIPIQSNVDPRQRSPQHKGRHHRAAQSIEAFHNAAAGGDIENAAVGIKNHVLRARDGECAIRAGGENDDATL